MICSVCYRMLRGQYGRQWKGTYDLYFIHHTERLHLKQSADASCCICRLIWQEVQRLQEEEIKEKSTIHGYSDTAPQRHYRTAKDTKLWPIKAHLSSFSD